MNTNNYYIRLGDCTLSQSTRMELLDILEKIDRNTLTRHIRAIGLMSYDNLAISHPILANQLIAMINMITIPISTNHIFAFYVDPGVNVAKHHDMIRTASINFSLTDTISNTIFYDDNNNEACRTSYEDGGIFLLNVNKNHSVINMDTTSRWCISLSVFITTYDEILRNNLIPFDEI